MLISVIIPLYNLGYKGNYCLKKCLNSLKLQTYENFEILMMENGSTDDTVHVAEEYSKIDERFKIIILNENGISNARNEGVKYAKGNYITFLDGDDYISENYLEVMVEIMLQDLEIDLGIVKTDVVYLNKNRIEKLYYFNDGYLNLERNLGGLNIPTVWGKVFKKNIILNNNIEFKKDLFGIDDIFFILEYVYVANKIFVSNDTTYFYVQGRKGQTTYTRKRDMVYGNVNFIFHVKKFLSEKNIFDEYKWYIDRKIFDIFIGTNFAQIDISKLSKKDVDNIINILKYDIYNVDINKNFKGWEIKWFNKFFYFTNKGLGFYFIKFIRIYRNIILQPFKIKFK